MERRPSPSHDARPAGQPVDILLIHYTGMQTAEAALERLCDPAAKVSAHYLIEENGRLWQLVDERRRAWHAGLAEWRGSSDVNGRSIGIELVNPGHEWGYRPFPAAQMASLVALCREVLARHQIPSRHVLGHSDVAPLRKDDPGELFDWKALAAAGIGLWPVPPSTTPASHASPPDPEVAQRLLAAFGYGYLDQDFAAVLRAFQRHFRPEAVTGELDGGTFARLEDLAQACRLT